MTLHASRYRAFSRAWAFRPYELAETFGGVQQARDLPFSQEVLGALVPISSAVRGDLHVTFYTLPRGRLRRHDWKPLLILDAE